MSDDAETGETLLITSWKTYRAPDYSCSAPIDRRPGANGRSYHVRVPAALARKLVVAFGIAFLGLLVAAGTLPALAQSPEPAASGSPGAALPGDPTKGQQLYNATCTTCHGASLEGGVGPKLNPLQKIAGSPAGKIGDPAVVDYLIATITNGKAPSDGFGAMPAKGGNTALSDQDVKDITAYIIQQNLNPGQTALGPVELARSNVFWVTVGVGVMVLLTWLLARYNMRWIAYRAQKGRG